MKTKYPGIIYDKKKKTYYAKFNYKEYDPKTGKNVYKARYKYNCLSLTEAKEELRRLQEQAKPQTDEDITLSGIFTVYEMTAKAKKLSPTTIQSSRYHLNSICRYIKSDTKLKHITIDTYNAMIIAMRENGLKETTIRTYSDCLKKLFRLAYMRDFITSNFFDKISVSYLPKRKTKTDEISKRLITAKEFNSLITYLKQRGRCVDGVDVYKTYGLLFSLLYYGGLRIGEALALRPADFETVTYKKNKSVIFQVAVTKTVLRVDGENIIKPDTKNNKNRFVPLPPKLQQAYLDYIAYLNAVNKPIDKGKRLFPRSYYCVSDMLERICKRAKINKHTLHDFRHTYISNLIANNLPISDVAYFSGDTEAVILDTYVHATEDYKLRLLEVLNKIQV